MVIIINTQKSELVEEILERAVNAAHKYLKSGAWREVKLVLRFLGCLQGVLEDDGVFPVLEELFSRAVDLQTASSEDVSTTCTILHVMLTLFIEPRLGACQNNSFNDSIHNGFFSHRI